MMNHLKRKILSIFLTFILISTFCSSVYAQITEKDTILQDASLQSCIQYALKHYPLVQQSLLNEEITEQQIKSKLSEWYPQLNLNAYYQHIFQLAAVEFNNSVSPSGTHNVSSVGI